MSMEPLVSQQEEQSNPILWCVKTYLDLISREMTLGYGNGLKRLYVLKSGIGTLNDDDITSITAKAEREKLLPGDLTGFMQQCICKNLELYGKELRQLITDRVVGISNGDIKNPLPQLRYSPVEARRYFYAPPFTYVRRVLKVATDYNGEVGDKYGIGSQPLVTSLQDVATDGDFLLTRLQIDEGHITPTETSWGALMQCVDRLIEILEQESRYTDVTTGYRRRARPACKILWLFAKMLMGDLTVTPTRESINLVDLDGKLSFNDGTLAAIPFPLQQTARIFADYDESRGVTLKGHMYLSAVGAAAFYRNTSR